MVPKKLCSQSFCSRMLFNTHPRLGLLVGIRNATVSTIYCTANSQNVGAIYDAVLLHADRLPFHVSISTHRYAISYF